MASDYPLPLQRKMSKYEFVYMDSIDDTLEQLKKVLTETDTLLTSETSCFLSNYGTNEGVRSHQ